MTDTMEMCRLVESLKKSIDNSIKNEYVVYAKGLVSERSSKNPNLPTGDIEVNVPIGYHEYLDNLYGKDWMQLPDESKRESHHTIKAYWA